MATAVVGDWPNPLLNPELLEFVYALRSGKIVASPSLSSVKRRSANIVAAIASVVVNMPLIAGRLSSPDTAQ